MRTVNEEGGRADGGPDTSSDQQGRFPLMATIRASCETCGDVELTTADIRIRVCIDDNRGDYSFTCPACEMTVLKSAEPRTIDLLVASGVSVDTWSLPAELDETKVGRPIDHNDLLEFHNNLHDINSWDEALADLLDVTPGSFSGGLEHG